MCGSENVTYLMSILSLQVVVKKLLPSFNTKKHDFIYLLYSNAPSQHTNKFESVKITQNQLLGYFLLLFH